MNVQCLAAVVIVGGVLSWDANLRADASGDAMSVAAQATGSQVLLQHATMLAAEVPPAGVGQPSRGGADRRTATETRKDASGDQVTEPPRKSVIRPKKVNAKQPGCKVSKPGTYQASPGDLIELEYTFPVVPGATPDEVRQETDKGAIYISSLGIRRLHVPDLVGAETYLFFFQAKHTGKGTAFLIVDQITYEFVFIVSKTPRRAGVNVGNQPGEPPIGLSCVEEMAFIPEVDSWEECEATDYPEAVVEARKAWQDEAKRIGPYVTPELARRLSKWAQKEMEAYVTVPSLAGVCLEPVSHYPKRNRLVLKGTVDTLPTHSPIVTRWFEVYLLCDISGKSIQHVTVTIRGERLE